MKWVLTDADESTVAALSDGAGLHPLVARLLCNRGITDAANAREFLDCDLSRLSDPMLFQGMDRAVERIRNAVSTGEKIVLYGDYDVDGVTGTSLLFLALKRLDAQVEAFIPDRASEGYGLKAEALGRIKASGAGVVLSVDCGINAFEEARASRSLGLDLIITDHHEISGSSIPDAHAVLHPLLLDAGTPATIHDQVSGLTGVGVAFKLAQALMGRRADDEQMVQYLDLVALGTIADVGRIIGENRALVKRGLEQLSLEAVPQRPGIGALKRVSALEGKKVGVGVVGFALAPRINAGGRLESADIAFRLLTTDSVEEAERLAGTLDELNTERQRVQEDIWLQARRICFRENTSFPGAFVLSSRDWHPGVIGIVASRLAEEFYRPTALVCVKDGIGKGSARSVPGFDLFGGLSRCSDLLIGFGGHTYAAGFSVAEDRIEQFRERLNAVVAEAAGPHGFERALFLDGSVELDVLTMGLLREIERLSPFGQGNPEPRLGARGLRVVSSRIVGKNHLRLKLKGRCGTLIDAIAFKQGDRHRRSIHEGARLAAVFTPRIHAWNGSTTVELDIKDIKIDKHS